MAASVDLDELVEHWTVLDDERALIDAKYGATRLAFALLLKFYTQHGRFPLDGRDVPEAAVEFVAKQVKVAPQDLGAVNWAGRSVERHRAQIRELLGFRECGGADVENELRFALDETIAHTWPGDCSTERRLHRMKNSAARLCPICRRLDDDNPTVEVARPRARLPHQPVAEPVPWRASLPANDALSASRASRILPAGEEKTASDYSRLISSCPCRRAGAT